ncbi:hypothetical protein DY000_02042779 [Brassica cretica]|uniref:Secreted protein n=1 Tax=Brassica cretica TaxID=69181 RepID=A0ABQ7B732_BRACR|nr:hypothetical protein DY000_02042779 [Brassica cretica]
MANSYTLLASLMAGRCSNTAEVQLLRFWEAWNKKGGELMMSTCSSLMSNYTINHNSANRLTRSEVTTRFGSTRKKQQRKVRETQ